MGRKWVALGLAGTLCACGADAVDIEGLYDVTAHTRNQTGCDPGEVVFDPSQIDVRREPDGFVVYLCGEFDPPSCSPSGWPVFSNAVEGGWTGHSLFVDPLPPCTVGGRFVVAKVPSDGALEIEVSHESQTFSEIPYDRCEPEQALLRRSELECFRFEQLTAMRRDE